MDFNSFDLEELAKNPMFLMGMNILSRSGPQPVKQNVGSILGQAANDTFSYLQQARMAQQELEMKRTQLDQWKAQTDVAKANAERMNRQLDNQEKWLKKYFGSNNEDQNSPIAQPQSVTPQPMETQPATTNQQSVTPDILKAMVSVESGGNPRAVSKKGALGLAQLMPSTIQRMKKVFGDQFNAFDPNDAMRGMEYEVNRLYQKYGDWDKVFAAYNAGEGPVDKAKGIPNYPETKQYVAKIKALLGQQQTIQPQKQNNPLGMTPEQMVEAGVSGSMMGVPGADALMEAAKFYEPKNIPANSYVRQPGSNQLTYLPNQVEQQRLAYETEPATQTGLPKASIDKAKINIMEKEAANILENYNKYQTAPTMIATIQRGKELAKQGGAFFGPFGDKKAAIASFLNNNLGLNIDPTGIQNNQEFGRVAAEQIAIMMRQIDAQPSQNQQEWLARAIGSANTDPKALIRVLDFSEKMVRSKIDQYNRVYDSSVKRGIPLTGDLRIELPKNAQKTGSSDWYNTGVNWLKSQNVTTKETARSMIDALRRRGWQDTDIRRAFGDAGIK